jgi:hypothetical protein
MWLLSDRTVNAFAPLVVRCQGAQPADERASLKLRRDEAHLGTGEEVEDVAQKETLREKGAGPL